MRRRSGDIISESITRDDVRCDLSNGCPQNGSPSWPPRLSALDSLALLGLYQWLGHFQKTVMAEEPLTDAPGSVPGRCRHRGVERNGPYVAGGKHNYVPRLVLARRRSPELTHLR